MVENDLNELQRLRQTLQATTAERDRLLEENRRLAQALKTGQEPVQSPTHRDGTNGLAPAATGQHTGATSLNSQTPMSDKVRLYRSLFRGREDVYARFWQSAQSGKSGYSPVCSHEWNRELCQKPRVRCGDCPNRDLVPITDAVIQNHLDGKITIGVYPLLEDDTCYFLAIDFDKRSWLEDSSAFLETCQMAGIPAALERSRSGNGAHVWIFFTEPVSASAARNLGCHLLTQTMSRRHELGMDSYDRLLPNQDTVPKGGFGNLIALPFQRQ